MRFINRFIRLIHDKNEYCINSQIEQFVIINIPLHYYSSKNHTLVPTICKKNSLFLLVFLTCTITTVGQLTQQKRQFITPSLTYKLNLLSGTGFLSVFWSELCKRFQLETFQQHYEPFLNLLWNSHSSSRY